jgi:integration host factor subunit beta
MAEKTSKADLIEILASRTDLTQKEKHSFIADLWDLIIKKMLEGKSIELRGFGTFEIKLRKGRKHARNPRTGEIVSVEDHGVAFFRPGREVKEKAWDAFKGNGGVRKRH